MNLGSIWAVKLSFKIRLLVYLATILNAFSFFILVGVCFPTFCWGRYVAVPDVAFRQHLRQKYPLCFDTLDRLDTTCASIIQARGLYCYSLPIVNLSGVEYFKGLDSLDCSHCEINFLPKLPNKLTYFDCHANQLALLPPLPPDLEFIDCSENKLTSVAYFPNKIRYIACSENKITNLPKLPDSLLLLAAGFNKLSTLPALPSKLGKLFCSNNQLYSLPSLPSSLTRLYCNNNELTTLPLLNNSLEFLICFYNSLSTLPALPSSLEALDCSFNLLRHLPVLPSNMGTLFCSNNQLTFLPSLPPVLWRLNCSSNLSLYCLPPLPDDFRLLIRQNTSISCLPNKPPDLVDSLPICLDDWQVCDSLYLSTPRPAEPLEAVSLSPNPTADGAFTLHLNGTKADAFSVYDQWGRQLIAEKRIEHETEVNILLDTKASGLYYLRLLREGMTTKVLPIVKN